MDTSEYIHKMKGKYPVSAILKELEKVYDLRVLVIGDTIIDQYTFVQPKGRAIKDPILSVEYLSEETYAGGILAIANHISTYVNNVKLVTLLGSENGNHEFIKSALSPNIVMKDFIKTNSPTTIKKRYIDHYKNNKLFKIEYINDKPISKDLTGEIVAYLTAEVPKYDLVILGDFGHGFINNDIRSLLESRSRFLSINVQSNSSNMGYNYINQYKSPDFITMDEQELRLPTMMRFEPVEEVIKEFQSRFGYSRFLISMGKRGSIYVNDGTAYRGPILTQQVKDTVGAGDALFAVCSLLVAKDTPHDLIPLIANSVGGIKVNYMGNKESVAKDKLISFIETVYEHGMGCL
jgi:bifunctional ADP-heptose synthase (sugar kinase/adenylyltransferase)